jgi:hypothetical protein
MNSDFRDLLKLFNAHRVRYLVVGGYAVMKYTEPRYTKDLDIWVEATPKNAKAVLKALRSFGAPLANLTEADFAAEGFSIRWGVPRPASTSSCQSKVFCSQMAGLTAC